MSRDTTSTIVLTGGPCGGKTASLPLIHRSLEAAGWRVLTIPEMASMLYSSGIRPSDYVGGDNAEFRQMIMQGQFDHENLWRRITSIGSDLRWVVLQDRGLFDECPYLASNEEFEGHLEALGLSRKDALLRYDLVVHLVSVAVDTPALYSTGSNPVRQEATASQARGMDEEIYRAWTGHPALFRIGNRDEGGRPWSFEDKVNRILGVIGSFLARGWRGEATGSAGADEVGE